MLNGNDDDDNMILDDNNYHSEKSLSNDNSNGNPEQLYVKVDRRDQKRTTIMDAATLMASRRKSLNSRDYCITTSREVLSQIAMVESRENNGNGLDSNNIGLTMALQDERSLNSRKLEENITYQRAAMMNSSAVQSTLLMSGDINTSTPTVPQPTSTTTTTTSNSKYTRRKSVVTTGGGTTQLASQEVKISGKIPQPVDKSSDQKCVDPELLPPVSKKPRLAQSIPNDISKGSGSTSIFDASSVLVSSSDVLPLSEYTGSLVSEKLLSPNDPFLGLLYDIGYGPIRPNISSHSISVNKSNDESSSTSDPQYKQRTNSNNASSALSKRTASIVSSIEDAMAVANGNNPEENTLASIGNVPDISILASDLVMKYFIGQINTAKNKQSEIHIGQLQSWQLHTNESGTPRAIKDNLSLPFTNEWNVESQLDSMAEEYIKNRCNKEEVHSMANTVDQGALRSYFSKQLMGDYDKIFQYDTIYNDPSIDEQTKVRLRERGVKGVIDSKYVPGQKMGEGFYPKRVDPDVSPDEAKILYEEALDTVVQRGIVFEEILREENIKTAKLESCYSTRTNKTVIANTSNNHRDIPWVTREYIGLFLSQFHPQQSKKMRQCRNKEYCVCNTLAQGHRGLSYPSNRPTHGVLSGTAPFSMSVPGTPSADIGRTVESNATAGLFVSHGFINVEFLLPDEFTHFITTENLPERDAECCVLCHIKEVNVNYHKASCDLIGLKTGSNGEIHPINRFQVYVDKPGEYNSNVCLSFFQGRGPSGIIGHFPIFLADRYQYTTYKPERLQMPTQSSTSNTDAMDVDTNRNNTQSSSSQLELQKIIEMMMDFRQS